ncbi:MAG: helix-turn-helix transcriptional regulator [Clostridia bacterium]|nr:helix-turn-helix transcriptional regulator [Clostridia bacterium]
MTKEEKIKRIELEKTEQKERGKRIKDIREKELKMKKTQLGRELGVSGQFIGLVEEGRGNLAYRSIKRLKELSGHSADYILYGIDDKTINDTKIYLSKYSEREIIQAINIIKEIAIFIKNS